MRCNLVYNTCCAAVLPGITNTHPSCWNHVKKIVAPSLLGRPILQVKPFSSADARDILVSQLGKPLREVFLDADTAFEVPVAAASLGQVRDRVSLVGTHMLRVDFTSVCRQFCVNSGWKFGAGRRRV